MRVAVIAGNFNDPVGRNLEGYENQHWGIVMKIGKTKINNSGVFWMNMVVGNTLIKKRSPLVIYEIDPSKNLADNCLERKYSRVIFTSYQF